MIHYFISLSKYFEDSGFNCNSIVGSIAFKVVAPSSNKVAINTLSNVSTISISIILLFLFRILLKYFPKFTIVRQRKNHLTADKKGASKWIDCHREEAFKYIQHWQSDSRGISWMSSFHSGPLFSMKFFIIWMQPSSWIIINIRILGNVITWTSVTSTPASTIIFSAKEEKFLFSPTTTLMKDRDITDNVNNSHSNQNIIIIPSSEYFFPLRTKTSNACNNNIYLSLWKIDW